METTVETHELKNGLKLRVIDDSRPIAGDRFQVVAILRMQVPVKTSGADARVLEQVDLDPCIVWWVIRSSLKLKCPRKGMKQPLSQAS